MVYKRGVPRALAALAALLMLLTAAGQAVAAPGSGTTDATDAQAGQVWSFGDYGPETKDRVSEYDVINPARDLSVVVGTDERVQVTQTDQYPNSAIAFIFAFNDDEEMGFRCTATFVAPNVLLTAAHCLYIPELGGWPDGIEVVPGISGAVEPFGYEFAADIWVPGGWVNANGDINEGYAYDYGLIKLPDNTLGDQVGTWEIGMLSTETLTAADFNPTTTGYPADKPEITQWFGSQPNFLQVDQMLLEHDIDAFQGQSGSAVWRGSDRAIVGVVSFETQYHNYARRIDQSALDGLLAGCEAMSCSFNYFVEGQETPPPPPPSGNGDASAFARTWDRTDKPVQDGEISRTWMWGPPFTDIIMERYDDSPNGERAVIYHEKSRMEITNPSGDPSSIWYITNGLIAKELVTGELQLGDNTFEQHQPAEINVAGDPGDQNAPTYATFGSVLSAEPLAEGTAITSTIDRAGAVGDDPGLGEQGVTAAKLVPETNHTVASVFWDFMNSSGLVYENGQFVEAKLFENPYFATGYPITEAYWTTVEVGGTPHQVLVQVFQRRVLTYTPGNGPGWAVEAGNVGTHYHTWRYELIPGEGGETPPPPPEPDPDPTPPPADGVPAEGDVVAYTDLKDLEPVEGPAGSSGASSENGYTITTPPGSLLRILAPDEFGDGSFSIRMRVTTPASSGIGCLTVAVDPEVSAHQFCLVYATGAPTAAGHSDRSFQQVGASIVGLIGVFQTPTSAEPTGDWPITPVDAGAWHELKVVVQSGTYWIIFDSAVVGSFSHEGPSSGNVGFGAGNAEGTEGVTSIPMDQIHSLIARSPAQSGTNAQIEYTDLTVRMLQQ